MTRANLVVEGTSRRPGRGAAGGSRTIVLGALAFVPLLLVIATAVLAPVLAPYSPVVSVGGSLLPPSAAHWFGTDAVGMDVLSRCLYGTRVAVTFGLIVTVIATVVGSVLGVLVGLAEQARVKVLRGVAEVISQLTNYFIAIPSIILGIVVVGVMGDSSVSLVLAISLTLVTAPIKLTRVEVLRVRTEAYLEAAELSGESKLHSAIVHVLPNSLGPAMRNMPLIFGNTVVILASLGFIGVGVKAPTPEWGYMMSSALSGLMLGQWWAATFPAIFLAASVLCVTASSHMLVRRLPPAVAAVKGRLEGVR